MSAMSTSLLLAQESLKMDKIVFDSVAVALRGREIDDILVEPQGDDYKVTLIVKPKE